MGCCTSGRLDGADLEIAFHGVDLIIKEKKPTYDSEGFADISLGSHRGSDLTRTDFQSATSMQKGTAKDQHLSSGMGSEDFEMGVQCLITPRFGGGTDRKLSGISLLDLGVPESKSVIGSKLTME